MKKRIGLRGLAGCGLGLALPLAQALPPALQEVDSRGFAPWIAQALQSASNQDLDWAAHLLLFCAESGRWAPRSVSS